MSETSTTAELRFCSEKKVSELLELPREKIREIRTIALELQDPEHFEIVKREVAYTPTGLARLLEYLRATGGEIPAELDDFVGGDSNSAEAAPEEPGEPESETLIVVHVCKNRHLIDAKKEGGEPVRVWVPNNRKFVPKMELQGRPRNGQASDFYELVGRCPRRKGRY